MQTGTRWLASLVIPLLLQVAACSGGSEDSGNGAPQGGGLALVISRTEIEPNTEESFTGCMTPDVLGFLRPGEQLQVFGLVGGIDSDAFAITFPAIAEITATLFILGNAELPPGSPAYDESRVVRITLYVSVDGRFDHDINGSLTHISELTPTRPPARAPADPLSPEGCRRGSQDADQRCWPG